MSTETDTRDRVIAVEVQLKHVSDELSAVRQQVSEMHDLLMQARGARWAIIGAATVGGFIAAKLVAWLPWFASFPGK